MMSSTIRLAFFYTLPLFPVFLQASSIEAPDQREDQRRAALYGESPLIYYEAFNSPAEDPSKSHVDITYRISHNFFIFVRNEKFTDPAVSQNTQKPNYQFIATAEITAELLDRSGVSVARELAQKEVGTDDPENPANKNEFLQGIFSFVLNPGEYTVVFGVDELGSSRQFLEKSRKVTLRGFSKNPLDLSDVLFIEPITGLRHEAQEFIPVNLGGDVFFGKNFEAYVEIARSVLTDTTLQLSYSLYRLGEEKNDTTFFVHDSLPSNIIANPKKLEIERTERAYLYRIRESRASDRFSALLPLDGDQLPQGNYELAISITDGVNAQSRVHPFRVRWLNMPRSLRDFQLAINALEYVATKEEMGDLRAMFASNLKERFEEFWKKRDPTPKTAFNEATAEYYRRVDYTMENFGTLKGTDGYKTDRGKIYILYGQPASTERKFSAATPPREIWNYAKLRKRFIFVDEAGRGDYKLAATENF